MNECLAIACPYCGENIYIEPEPSDQEISYVEDCHVCCRPVVLSVRFSLSGTRVEARRENE